jgi:hypothetical protein
VDAKSLCQKFIWVGIFGIGFSILCLAANGAGDAPESFRMYLLCSSILIAASLLSLALIGRRDDK